MNYVRSLTERYGAEIHVLYVITDLAHHRGLYGNFEQDHIDKMIAWEPEIARWLLKEGGNTALNCRISVQGMLDFYYPSTAIKQL